MIKLTDKYCLYIALTEFFASGEAAARGVKIHAIEVGDEYPSSIAGGTHTERCVRINPNHDGYSGFSMSVLIMSDGDIAVCEG